MAITAAQISSAILAANTSGGLPLLGVSFARIASAVGAGLQAWGLNQPQNLALTGATFGQAGLGLILPVTTRIIIPPNPAPMIAGLSSSGVVGPTSPSVATAVTVGISTSFGAFAQYTGPVPGVQVGPDTSKITIANPATAATILTSTILAVVGQGPSATLLATGLAKGIVGLMLLGSGAGFVSPAPGSPPPAGASIVSPTGPCAIV